MTRAEVEDILRPEHPALTWSWIEVNESDPSRANIPILRIKASGGGMYCIQDFAEKYLTKDDGAADRVRDAVKVLRVWVKDHDEMAARAAKQAPRCPDCVTDTSEPNPQDCICKTCGGTCRA